MKSPICLKMWHTCILLEIQELGLVPKYIIFGDDIYSYMNM
jgi:hypothetical protein